jgi:hypothetical protein
MKLALIPPLGFERYFALSDGVQMGLCVNSCINSPWYIRALTERAEAGDYVIMDNGAAEGDRCGNRDLRSTAKLVKAREVILPDVIGNRGRTLSDMATYIKFHLDASKNYMAVIQGQDPDDLKKFVHDVADRHVQTLGIPRDLIKPGRLQSIRIDLANWIDDEFPGRFQIHLLGTNSAWIEEIRAAAKYAPHIRSVDTSAPFVYANRNLFLGDMHAKTIKSVRRPLNYLDPGYVMMYPPLVDRNIQVMKQWAQGTDA